MARNLLSALRAARIDPRTAFPPRLSQIIAQGRSAVTYMTYWSPALDQKGNLWVPDLVLDPGCATRGGTLQIRVEVSAGRVNVDIPTQYLHRIISVTDTTGWIPADDISFDGRP